MEDVVIAGYGRTPLGSFQGDLAQLSAPELGGKAIEKAISCLLYTSPSPRD